MSTRPLGQTLYSVDLRMTLLRAQGHTITLAGDRTQFTVALRRKDDRRHVVTITPDDLTENERAGPIFLAYPQQMLMIRAFHAICDWNDSQD